MNEIYSLLQFLQKYTIEVPPFQRDYAQGRADKGKVREKILAHISAALSGSDGTLDFVYGYAGDTPGTIHLLDGQQRLTSLWLVHWYIAAKALSGDELEKALATLTNLTYSTRRSSKDFLAALCMPENASAIGNDANPAEAIRKAVWFSAAWLQDPTVQGIMRMLEASGGNDNIPDVFPNPTAGMWQWLAGDTCSLKFEFLHIKDLEVRSPQKLYVKMNSRGKQLSDFENFKADLVDHLTDKLSDEEAVKYAALIDNDWGDCFWDRDQKDFNIDARKMTFFTRFWLFMATEKAVVSANRRKDADKGDKDSSDDSFGLKVLPFYRCEVEKPAFTYSSFDIFASSQGFSASEAMITLGKIFTGIARIGGESALRKMLPAFFAKFDFIPGFDSSIPKLTQHDQALFFAIARFFVVTDGSSAIADPHTALSRWIRVCSNLIANYNTSATFPEHLSTLILIDELSSHASDIYCHLKTLTTDGKSNNALTRQLNEEIVKARHILAHPDEEAVIRAAEETAFFEGAIRFLYRDGSLNEDWSRFTDKLAVAGKIFDRRGAVNGASALSHFISICTDWNQIGLFRNKIPLGNNAAIWKAILLRNRLAEPVCTMLLTWDSRPETNSCCLTKTEDGYDMQDHLVQEALSHPVMMHNIIDIMGNKGYIQWYRGHYIVYPDNAKANWRKYCVDDRRHELLSAMRTVIKCGQWIGPSPYLWGYDYDFSLLSRPGVTFRWLLPPEGSFYGNIVKVDSEGRIIKVESEGRTITPSIDVDKMTPAEREVSALLSALSAL